mmetsp:Transcript_147859/g.474664  ORF Transcript_147859/g.474664 Transcript_147859/m.474664 type:complete len:548 (-) Transcript_147859:210-1853(-)
MGLLAASPPTGALGRSAWAQKPFPGTSAAAAGAAGPPGALDGGRRLALGAGAAERGSAESRRSWPFSGLATLGVAAAGLRRQCRRSSGKPSARLVGSTARAASVAPPPEGAAKKFVWAKWRTFWACFFGYSVCYFTRQSLSYTAPFLKQAMGWDSLAQIGQLSSLFPLAYGSSRFLGGVLGDRMSPSKVFCLGLSVCGALNIAFGLSSSLPMFALIWCLNGCFQGLVAPPCVKMITNWFDPKERGFWWSIWHASINLGGFCIPFLAGGLAQTFGWRYGMIGPGALAIGMAGLCFFLMQDGPKEAAPKVTKASQDGAPKGADEAKPAEAAKKIGVMEGIVMNPVQWALGLAYLLVYVCRQGLGIWGIFYLMHSGVPNAGKAAALFSGFELGGFMGNLTAGSFSDLLLRRAKPGDGEAGQRAKVVGVYFVATLVLLPLLGRCPSSWPLVQYSLLLGLGHFLCGAQLLLPLIAAEVAPKELTSTATGFIGWVGYFGAALSGLPLSRVVQGLGWGWYFTVLTTAAALGAALLVPLSSLKSYRQLAAEKAGS